MATLLVTGDNLKVVDEDGVQLFEESGISDGIGKDVVFDEYGISEQTFGEFETHRLLFIEKLKATLRKEGTNPEKTDGEPDEHDLRAIREYPDFFMLFRPGHEYSSQQVKYQIFRNMSQNSMAYGAVFDVHRYGAYYYSTKTGEETIDPVGFNIFDEWEPRRGSMQARIPGVKVCTEGNFSLTVQEPYVKYSAPKEQFEKFLQRVEDSVRKEITARALNYRHPNNNNGGLPLGRKP